jgi:hypothetical protein
VCVVSVHVQICYECVRLCASVYWQLSTVRVR